MINKHSIILVSLIIISMFGFMGLYESISPKFNKFMDMLFLIGLYAYVTHILISLTLRVKDLEDALSKIESK